jgi:hypothetical protein
MLLDARVRSAHADAWSVEAGLREGGAALALRGIRVMASGLAHPQWNSADVTAPEPDLEGARAFYADRDLAWGVRVPEGMPWSAGRPIIRLRLMGLPEDGFRPAPPVAGLSLRAAGPGDLETVLDIDCSAFESDREEMRPWTTPHLGAPAVTVALAALDGSPVGTGYARLGFADAGALHVYGDL